ncbi:MAG: hypothetical protein KAS39_07745, partial [Actinomycetia bacterium]|nr:hypothetical protein [Actinomycetes bacterium]
MKYFNKNGIFIIIILTLILLNCARSIKPPDNVSATDGTYTNKVEISWDSVSGADEYYIYRCTIPATAETADNYYDELGHTDNTDYNDSTGSRGKKYYYRVRGYNKPLLLPNFIGSKIDLTYSDFSDYDSGYWGQSAPTNISASDSTYSDKIVITWGSVPGSV